MTNSNNVFDFDAALLNAKNIRRIFGTTQEVLDAQQALIESSLDMSRREFVQRALELSASPKEYLDIIIRGSQWRNENDPFYTRLTEAGRCKIREIRDGDGGRVSKAFRFGAMAVAGMTASLSYELLKY